MNRELKCFACGTNFLAATLTPVIKLNKLVLICPVCNFVTPFTIDEDGNVILVDLRNKKS